jgi:hypothetical protein
VIIPSFQDLSIANRKKSGEIQQASHGAPICCFFVKIERGVSKNASFLKNGPYTYFQKRNGAFRTALKVGTRVALFTL